MEKQDKRKRSRWTIIFAIAVTGSLPLLLVYAQDQKADFSQKPASNATIKVQQEALLSLPADDGRDMEFVHRGIVSTLDDPVIRRDDGTVVADPAQLDWVDGEAPDTVNPSLWRHMKLLRVHGLFKVVNGLWQIRGLDGSNMTIVRGDTGWIIIDPLMTTETATRAMELVDEHLGKRPVTAVVYTHTHPDHFGGVRGVLGEGEVTAKIFAPEGFMEEITSEFLMAGNAMGRRVSYQFGSGIEVGPRGNVGGGIVSVQADGTIRLIPPTDYIVSTGEVREIDGVSLEFQMVPETEAPVEMNVYVPALRVFYISEFATCTMHNIQTPRGALVRDALQWADFLTEAINRYGHRTDVITTGHCWPRFGEKVVQDYLKLQRNNYKFIHDQTVRMMNLGETPTEIAEQLSPPAEISNEWSNRGYYGTLRHNAKGVYQYYIGWWNGNPANLDLHPPVERAKRYVSAMGGVDAVIKLANTAMEQGDYRWSAETLNHLVFTDPDNMRARALLADSLEQMGYQSESAVWRNYFLSGAAELRGQTSPKFWLSNPDLPKHISIVSSLEVVATRLNPALIGSNSMTLALAIADTEETVLVSIENGVMVVEVDKNLDAVDVILSGDKNMFLGLFLQGLPLEQAKEFGLKVSGDISALNQLLGALEIPPSDFPVVLP